MGALLETALIGSFVLLGLIVALWGSPLVFAPGVWKKVRILMSRAIQNQRQRLAAYPRDAIWTGCFSLIGIVLIGILLPIPIAQLPVVAQGGLIVLVLLVPATLTYTTINWIPDPSDLLDYLRLVTLSSIVHFLVRELVLRTSVSIASKWSIVLHAVFMLSFLLSIVRLLQRRVSLSFKAAILLFVIPYTAVALSSDIGFLRWSLEMGCPVKTDIFSVEAAPDGAEWVFGLAERPGGSIIPTADICNTEAETGLASTVPIRQVQFYAGLAGKLFEWIFIAVGGSFLVQALDKRQPVQRSRLRLRHKMDGGTPS